MLLLLFIAVGALAGFVCGGRWSGLAQGAPRGLWLCILSFLVQGAASLLPMEALNALAPASVWQVTVAVLRYGLLLAFAALNLWEPRAAGKHSESTSKNHRPPGRAWVWLFGAGTLANATVILANGGAMPVAGRLLEKISPIQAAALSAGEVFGYTLETAATRLPFLGDVLYIGTGALHAGFASVGDLLVGAGAGLLVFSMLRTGSPSGKRAADAGGS